MQWGSKECQSFFARRYPPTKSITKQHRRQSLTPRCQSVATLVSSPAETGPPDFASASPPRRSKPPLRLSWVTLILLLHLITIVAADSNSTDATPQRQEASGKDRLAVKLRVYPAARHAEPVYKTVEFECTGGQPPYRWEYHIQDPAAMSVWRYNIRHNRDNCKPNVTTRSIPVESARVRANASTGRLIFDWTELNDTGIYRCFSSATSDYLDGCIELHLLVFEPTSYLPHIRLIYGLFAVVIFVASLSTAWQLWNTSAFHRKAIARSRSDETAKGAIGSGHSSASSGFGVSLNPVIRFFSRSRSSSGNKAATISTVGASDDAARWPVLRRRLSSIDDPVAVVTVPIPVEVATAEEQIRVALEENHS